MAEPGPAISPSIDEVSLNEQSVNRATSYSAIDSDDEPSETLDQLFGEPIFPERNKNVVLPPAINFSENKKKKKEKKKRKTTDPEKIPNVIMTHSGMLIIPPKKDEVKEQLPIYIGYCCKWVKSKKFGFIRVDDFNTDIFIHQRELKDRTNRQGLSIGENVTFNIVQDRNGKPEAINVAGDKTGIVVHKETIFSGYPPKHIALIPGRLDRYIKYKEKQRKKLNQNRHQYRAGDRRDREIGEVLLDGNLLNLEKVKNHQRVVDKVSATIKNIKKLEKDSNKGPIRVGSKVQNTKRLRLLRKKKTRDAERRREIRARRKAEKQARIDAHRKGGGRKGQRSKKKASNRLQPYWPPPPAINNDLNSKRVHFEHRGTLRDNKSNFINFKGKQIMALEGLYPPSEYPATAKYFQDWFKKNHQQRPQKTRLPKPKSGKMHKKINRRNQKSSKNKSPPGKKNHPRNQDQQMSGKKEYPIISERPVTAVPIMATGGQYGTVPMMDPTTYAQYYDYMHQKQHLPQALTRRSKNMDRPGSYPRFSYEHNNAKYSNTKTEFNDESDFF